ncbi:AAEL017214-PA [Aedes aegypti]|uniref:AAEL017214-PA n=1 Tax=Aedes aegypti TaxID=7159 RepID=J9HYI5_AEDAE|nr:AAEL017214-PA [Aedes aegypti]
MSKRGKTQLCVDGYLYTRAKTTEELQFWTCNQDRVLGCSARASTGRGKRDDKPIIKLRGFHNHRIILERRKPGECAKLMEKVARQKGEEVLPARRKRLPPLPVECVLVTDNTEKAPEMKVEISK